MERLAAAVEVAAAGERDWEGRLSAGLAAGLELLAADPPLAHRLLVEVLATTRPARLEYERSLLGLAEAIRSPTVSAQTARLFAGGLASHVSGRVLAGEAEHLPEDHDLLLRYLLAPTAAATSSPAERRSAERA